MAVLSQDWPLNGQMKTAKARLKVRMCLLRMHSVSALPSTLLNKLLYEVVTLVPKKGILGKIFPLVKAEGVFPKAQR